MIPLLLAILPLSPQDTDYAPEVEINRYHCADDAKHVFTQVIFYEYRQGSRVIKDWRLAKDMRWERNAVTWTESDRLCVVRFGKLRETVTVDDPEVLDRQTFPKEWRSGLFHRGPR